MPHVINGKVVRDEIAARLQRDISALAGKPKLAIIQLGDRSDSNAYIKQKKSFGERVGALVEHYQYPETIKTTELQRELEKLNSDASVHGIIVQLPLPDRLDKNALVAHIAPSKDVDGLTPGSRYTPATAKGVLTLLDYYHIPIAGTRAVVVGRSALVGKPIALALLQRNATVTVCHRQTPDLASITRQADLLIVAAGSPGLITPAHVTPRQTVIDVGITVLTGADAMRRIAGDVDYPAVAPLVAAISPVPGGVGPMTVASLFENVVEAYRAVV